ncbi:hypothetical protein O1611_g2776 [Lasiodiplodia mahajangana]|uniref:Uncharacterized protein n=1 Tax=Lasiodiplodia mahajangana TaxID=1108764 RepID=A0ACC2JTW4_9PEZI|nr:hypothetical protein O1611_g2776 [Lasiodiplodia mahajangana]
MVQLQVISTRLDKITDHLPQPVLAASGGKFGLHPRLGDKRASDTCIRYHPGLKVDFQLADISTPLKVRMPIRLQPSYASELNTNIAQ